jgi:gluconate 2-dehydrogenase gamma chain
MSEISRRDVLRNVALSAMLGSVSAEAGQHVHEAATQDKQAAGGVYKPKALNEREYVTVRRLCDLIIPGSLDGGAPEFIDLLSSQNPEMAAIYTGGIAWIEHEMGRRFNTTFVAAKPEQQTALLDLIAYRKNETPELAAGIRFFAWIRKMTADAYYTSKVGIADVGYMGNKGMAKFEVPAEAIQYALKRSGLG